MFFHLFESTLLSLRNISNFSSTGPLSGSINVFMLLTYPHTLLNSFLNWFFCFYKFIYFIYFCLHWVFVAAHWLSLVAASRALRCSEWPFHCSGFSCGRAWALGVWASVVVAGGLSSVAHRLSSTGSVVVSYRLSCLAACGIFLDQGSNTCPLHWQMDS